MWKTASKILFTVLCLDLRIAEAQHAAGVDDITIARDTQRLTDITFASFHQNATYGGHYHLPFAQLNYQAEGNKLLITMSLVEAISSMCDAPIEDILVDGADVGQLLLD